MKLYIKKLLKKISLLKDMYITLMHMMDNEYGEQWRFNYYKKKLKFLGENVIFSTGITIKNPEYISIDSNTHIDKNVMLIASAPDIDLSKRILKERENKNYTKQKGELFIGKNCHISQYTMIYSYYGVLIEDNSVLSAGAKVYSLTSMHNDPNHPEQIVSIVPYSDKSPTLAGPVLLSTNVWIGINSIISPGVSIGKNSFVRSNSVVMNSFDENSYIAGDPAIFLRNRFDTRNS